MKTTLRPEFNNNGHISEFSKTGASVLQTSPVDKYNLKEIMNNKYFISHQKKEAVKKMQEKLNELGPATYHHHFHNAVIGSSEP